MMKTITSRRFSKLNILNEKVRNTNVGPHSMDNRPK